MKNTVVWEYAGTDNDRPQWTFYSSFISSARRLPNGNTLIDEGMNGRLLQVTPRWRDRMGVCKPLFRPGSDGPGRKEAGEQLDLRGAACAL